MRVLRAAAVRVRALVRRRSTDDELDEEMRYHLERDVERRIARGERPADARLAARRAFGNVTALTEQARGASRVEALEQAAQDARYALRVFRGAPRFALTVVLTIGLGLGLVTTAFTIFDAYVLRPLAVRDPRSLYEITLRDRTGRARNATLNEHAALTRANPAFAESFAYRWLMVRRDGEPLMVQAVTGNYFAMLGVPAALGRTIVPADADAAAGTAVIVLSHRAWRTKFGGDSAIVGRRVLLRGRSFEIIGVAREGFDGLTDLPLDFWTPITIVGALVDGLGPSDADQPIVRIVGRLLPGMSEAGAAAALSAWVATLTAERPEPERVATVALESRATATYMSSETMVVLAPVFALFALVLFIACANVANMMLARGMARQREIGIRLALGAGRARLVRQLLAEALLLAVPAGVAGFLLSRLALGAGVKLIVATVPPVFASYIRVVSLAPDARLFAFLFAGAIASAVAFGLVPALQTTRTNVIEATRGEFGVALRPTRIRNALVIGQVTMCAMLLELSGILLRNAERLDTLDIGFRADGLVQVFSPMALHHAIVERLGHEPGVSAIAATSHAPLDGRLRPIAVSGAATAHAGAAGSIRVSPGYFQTLGIPIVRGRTFSVDEGYAGEAVVVINDAAALELWPNGDALGATILLGSGGRDSASPPRAARVIGVASNVVLGFIGERRDRPTVYEPAAVDTGGMTLLVRTRSAAGTAQRSIRHALSTIDPGGSVEIHTLDEAMAMQAYPFRVAHWIASLLGGIALVLTISGVYGVLAYIVALRRKEIGIRVALGATRRIVVALVVRQSVRLAVTGVVIGSLLALGMARFGAAYIPTLPTFDGIALMGGAAIVLLSALGAAYVPSRRAAAVDPVETLRN